MSIRLRILLLASVSSLLLLLFGATALYQMLRLKNALVDTLDEFDKQTHMLIDIETAHSLTTRRESTYESV
jgi:hypothetical protein